METSPRPCPVYVPAVHDGARPAFRRGGQSGVRGASPLTARRPKEAAADWPRLQAAPGIRSGGLRRGPGPPCVAEVWPTGNDFSPLHYSQARGAATEGHRAYPRWARESSARAAAAQRPGATPRPWRPAPPASPCTTPLLTRPTPNHSHAQHYSLRAGCAVRVPTPQRRPYRSLYRRGRWPRCRRATRGCRRGARVWSRRSPRRGRVLLLATSASYGWAPRGP
jgi:hypothetical protein